MSYVYNAWPTTANVDGILSQLGVTPRAGVGDADKQALIDAVAAEAQQRTRRQFVPTTETRRYDGSGTPELEVDEFVSLSSVTLLGYLGAAQSSLLLSDFQAVTEANKPQTRIVLFRGAVPAIQGVYLDRFPAGRQNVEIAGSWGYGSSVPADLWQAVAEESAARLAEKALFQPGYDSASGTYEGRLKSWSSADAANTFDFVTLDEGVRVTRRYANALKRYTRPDGARLRRWKAPLI